MNITGIAFYSGTEADNMEKQAMLYECALCSSFWFIKRNYNHHKRLYHRGLPMIETIKGNTKTYVLDFIPSCFHKPTVYTCDICCTNFLDIDEITVHNFTKHISLMRPGHIKITKVERETHTSWS